MSIVKEQDKEDSGVMNAADLAQLEMRKKIADAMLKKMGVHGANNGDHGRSITVTDPTSSHESAYFNFDKSQSFIVDSPEASSQTSSRSAIRKVTSKIERVERQITPLNVFEQDPGTYGSVTHSELASSSESRPSDYNFNMTEGSTPMESSQQPHQQNQRMPTMSIVQEEIKVEMLSDEEFNHYDNDLATETAENGMIAAGNIMRPQNNMFLNPLAMGAATTGALNTARQQMP
jgi:hypothetical protein